MRAINSDGTVVCTNDFDRKYVDRHQFVEFGRRDCTSGTTVYSGWTAGGHSGHPGSGSNVLCMPPYPEYLPEGTSRGSENGGLLYATQFQYSGDQVLGSAFYDLQGREAACALCAADVDDTLLVPGRGDCAGHAELQTLYAGWLFSTKNDDVHTSEYVCMTQHPEMIDQATGVGGQNIYPVELMSKPDGDQYEYTLNKPVGCSVCGVNRPADPEADRARKTFTRWGHSECPTASGTVYTGWVASGRYNQHGSGSTQLCLPYQEAPPLRVPLTQSNTQLGNLYRTEYRSSAALPTFTDLGVDNNEVPCAVCIADAHVAITMPAWHECPTGWTEQYDGWLMAEKFDHNHNSKWVCVDHQPKLLNGSNTAAQADSNLLYAAEVMNPPNTNYQTYTEVPCAVCTKSAGAGALVTLSSFCALGPQPLPHGPGRGDSVRRVGGRLALQLPRLGVRPAVHATRTAQVGRV